jgi:hypothetical protein
MGLLLFGLTFGYLAIAQPSLLFHSWFLLAVGLVALTGYVVLARLYWFRAPFNLLGAAPASYVVSVVASRA